MSSKVAPRSAAATPTIVSQSPSLVLSVPPTASSHSLLPQVHSSAFKHRFKAMLDKPRSSTFVVNVTIHELGNVPQLEGQFAVRWKFRGRRPHDADRLLEHPVERLVATEAKIMAKTNPVKLLRNSQSVRSLRTVSSIGTTPPSANWMVNRAIIPHTPHHAASLPVASHDSALYNSEMERKTTDLAPLCSGTPLDNEPHLIVDEPECMNGSRTTRHGTLASEGSLDLSSSMMHENETSTPQSGPSVRSSGLYQSGNSSTPSLVSIVQSISADKGSRVPSRASTRSDASGTKNGVNAFLSLAMDHDSMDRKGHTPTCAIRSHAVTWEYKVQHVLRIPLGKEVEVESSKHHSHKAGAGAKTTLPILGGGLLSESSLKLDIEQIDKRGENVKNPAGQSVLFGYVNIDLAPFADHGPVTRKFLLQNSKTNATIRITIDMRYIGGEQDWAAPPMEGHLVHGISELTGDEHFSELQLLPSSSRSSNSDLSHHSVTSGRRSTRSTVSLAKLPPSVVGAIHTSKHRYRTYEHHLLPEVVSKKQTMQTRSAGPDLGSRAHSYQSGFMSPGLASAPVPQWIDSPSVASDSTGFSPRLFPGESSFTTSPLQTPFSLNSSPPSSPPLSPSWPHRPSFGALLSPMHSHMDGGAPLSTSATRGSALNGLSPVTTHLDSDQDSPLASSALFGDSALAPHFHQHHSNFLRDRDEDAHEIQPDVVIESIFNPTAANEYTPFTFLASEDHGVENDGDADDTENDDGFEPGITRAQLIHARHGVAHPNAWDKLRRRVINSHHLKTQT